MVSADLTGFSQCVPATEESAGAALLPDTTKVSPTTAAVASVTAAANTFVGSIPTTITMAMTIDSIRFKPFVISYILLSEIDNSFFIHLYKT